MLERKIRNMKFLLFSEMRSGIKRRNINDCRKLPKKFLSTLTDESRYNLIRGLSSLSSLLGVISPSFIVVRSFRTLRFSGVVYSFWFISHFICFCFLVLWMRLAMICSIFLFLHSGMWLEIEEETDSGENPRSHELEHHDHHRLSDRLVNKLGKQILHSMQHNITVFHRDQPTAPQPGPEAHLPLLKACQGSYPGEG